MGTGFKTSEFHACLTIERGYPGTMKGTFLGFPFTFEVSSLSKWKQDYPLGVPPQCFTKSHSAFFSSLCRCKLSVQII